MSVWFCCRPCPGVLSSRKSSLSLWPTIIQEYFVAYNYSRLFCDLQIYKNILWPTIIQECFVTYKYTRLFCGLQLYKIILWPTIIQEYFVAYNFTRIFCQLWNSIVRIQGAFQGDIWINSHCNSYIYNHYLYLSWLIVIAMKQNLLPSVYSLGEIIYSQCWKFKLFDTKSIYRYTLWMSLDSIPGNLQHCSGG